MSLLPIDPDTCAAARASLTRLESQSAAIKRTWPRLVDELRLGIVGSFKSLKERGVSLENFKAAKEGLANVCAQMEAAVAAWERGEAELAELREALRPVRDLSAAIKRQLDQP